jgi:hypothetical protein
MGGLRAQPAIGEIIAGAGVELLGGSWNRAPARG